AIDTAAEEERNGARLLRHDARHGVVLLGETERGAVSRAEILAEARVDGERQEAGRGSNSIGLDDHGAVVERRSGLEDARQQVIGDGRIERDAALDVVAKTDLALDDNDRADAPRRKRARGDHKLLDGLVGALQTLEVPEEGSAS